MLAASPGVRLIHAVQNLTCCAMDEFGTLVERGFSPCLLSCRGLLKYRIDLRLSASCE